MKLILTIFILFLGVASYSQTSSSKINNAQNAVVVNHDPAVLISCDGLPTGTWRVNLKDSIYFDAGQINHLRDSILGVTMPIFITSEVDPVWCASASFGISGGDISNWNTAFSDYFPMPGGTVFQYLRGDGSLAAFPSIPAAQVQGNWTESNNALPEFIRNKPSIPTLLSQLSNDVGFISGITAGDIVTALGFSVQPLLVSSTNVKTVNGNSLLGSGNVSVGTVVSVGVSGPEFTGGTPVTGSGNIPLALAASGVVAGTYDFLTVNSKGIITSGYNSSRSTLSTRVSGTAYQASNTGRAYDLDFTVKITSTSALGVVGDGQVTLETSANGTTGWTEYTRGQTTVGGVLATTAGTQQLAAFDIPAGTWYRLVFVVNSGTVSWNYIVGHEILRR